MSSRRRGFFRWTLCTLALAAAIHLAGILACPYIMMDLIRSKAIASAGTNNLHHGRRPTAESREVRMPSPDLLYSAGAFDLAQGALHITAPCTGSYMSLSLYGPGMENFFVQNDRQVSGGKFDIILLGPGRAAPKSEGAQIVHAPDNNGLLLFRFFAGNGARAEQIEAARRKIRCETLK